MTDVEGTVNDGRRVVRPGNARHVRIGCTGKVVKVLLSL